MKNLRLTFSYALLTLVIPLGKVNGFTVGVPPLRSVCVTMTPQHHKYLPQDTEAPFTVSVNKKEVSAGSPMEVTLTSLDPKTKFIGFYLQARNDDDTPIGSFTPNEDTKIHSCSGVRGNAAHHASGEIKKTNLTISWMAPKKYQGEVSFTATILRDFVTYWVFIMSEPVTITEATSSSEEVMPGSGLRLGQPMQRLFVLRDNINGIIGRTLNDVGQTFSNFFQTLAGRSNSIFRTTNAESRGRNGVL